MLPCTDPLAGPRGRTGGALPLILALVAVLAIAAATAWLRLEIDSSEPEAEASAFAVRRGSFDITVPCSGELAALRQIEVRNQLENGATITYIVPEGTTVEAGDELIHLAEEEILNKVKDAVDEVKTAEASLVAAEAALEIARSSQESALDAALLEVELSRLALKGWLDGDVVSMIEQLALRWETANINYERLREKYGESVELKKEGFISGDELKQDEIAMIEAKATLDQADLDIDVYARYTYPTDEARMESAVEQAQAELDRVRQRHAAELLTREADVESKAYHVESRKKRLSELRRQHSYCSVVAPTSGLVVYASSLESGHGHHGRDEPPPQVGTALRPNELVMLLPDTTEMIAAVKVNEALSGLIEPGQKAVVTSDVMPGVDFAGEVLSIGVLAEGGSWRDPNRRDYTVRVAIETPEKHMLKPSMRCRATVHVDRVTDVLHVPIRAVNISGDEASVFITQGARYRRQRVEVGRSSDAFVEVRSGLAEGDLVLLRTPRPDEIIEPAAAVLTASR